MTPGPVVMTATFIGYYVANIPGALVATTMMFLPSVVFVLLAAPLAERMATLPWVEGVVSGLVAATAGLILGEVYHLAPGAISGGWSWGVLVASGAAILWRRWDPTLVILAGGCVGAVMAP